MPSMAARAVLVLGLALLASLASSLRHTVQPAETHHAAGELNASSTWSTVTQLEVVNAVAGCQLHTAVSEVSDGDWVGDRRPDRNFNNVDIEPGSSQTRDEEITWGAPQDCWFRLQLTCPNRPAPWSGDKLQVSLRMEQRLAAGSCYANSAGQGLIAFRGMAGELRRLVVLPGVQAGGEVSWMSHVDDNLLLSDMSIPGTHDSGSTRCVLGNTQQWSLGGQLSQGIRFFDLRLMRSGNSLLVYHGTTNCELNAVEVFTTISDFLGGHPRETVIVLVNQENSHVPGQEFGNAVADLVLAGGRPLPELLWKGSKMPRLGEARGKLVLLKRYGGTGNDRLDGLSLTGWGDNPHGQEEVHSGDVTWMVQDAYSDGFDSGHPLDGDQKFEWIRQHLDRAAGDLRPEVLYLNFLSYAPTGLYNPQYWADSFYKSTFTWLVTTKDARYFGRRWGVVIMDFPRDELINLVIASNMDRKPTPQ